MKVSTLSKTAANQLWRCQHCPKQQPISFEGVNTIQNSNQSAWKVSSLRTLSKTSANQHWRCQHCPKQQQISSGGVNSVQKSNQSAWKVLTLSKTSANQHWRCQHCQKQQPISSGGVNSFQNSNQSPFTDFSVTLSFIFCSFYLTICEGAHHACRACRACRALPAGRRPSFVWPMRKNTEKTQLTAPTLGEASFA